jgi:hypothetical protein
MEKVCSSKINKQTKHHLNKNPKKGALCLL